MSEPTPLTSLNRRNFLRGSLIAGTSAAILRSSWAQEPSDKLQVALIGCGSQGKVLTDALNAIQVDADKVHLRAACDINKREADGMAGVAKSRGNDTTAYYDAEEMFTAEAGKIDAVFVATPDFVHHVYAIMAMEAGCDVYCEKMMSNRIASARDIVLASQQTNSRLNRPRIVQIGHQRRSNPRYLAAKQLKEEFNLFGRLLANYAQWNRSLSSSIPKVAPSRRALLPDDAILRRYGFVGGPIAGTSVDMSPLDHYLNWRMFKAYGGGAISDLGAHQIDLFAWFLGANPTRVSAQGGVDFFNNDDAGHYELPDTVQAMYEFETAEGKANCLYQVVTTNPSQASHERWQGVNGTLVLGEVAKDWNTVYRDDSITADKAPKFVNTDSWTKAVEAGLIGEQNNNWRNFWDEPNQRADGHGGWEVQGEGSFVDLRVSKAPGQFDLLTNFTTPPHTPHLQNFVQAVKSGDKAHLNCPAEEGFKTCVIVLKVYEALAQGGTATFDPAEFTASAGPVTEPGTLADTPQARPESAIELTTPEPSPPNQPAQPDPGQPAPPAPAPAPVPVTPAPAPVAPVTPAAPLPAVPPAL